MVSPTETPSVILTETSTRHSTDLPFQIPWWVRRQFKRQTGHVTVRAVILNPPEKITRQNLHVSDPSFFFNSKTFSSVIQSVTTDGNILSGVTDWITDGKVSVGSYRLNYGRKCVRRWFRPQIIDRHIPSVNPLLFNEFLVVWFFFQFHPSTLSLLGLGFIIYFYLLSIKLF